MNPDRPTKVSRNLTIDRRRRPLSSMYLNTLRLLATVSAVAVIWAPSASGVRADTARDDAAPMGTVSHLSRTFPNYWWDYRNDPKAVQSPSVGDASVSSFADLPNHRIFEFNTYEGCPYIVAYDSVTAALVATDKTCKTLDTNGNSKVPVVAVDSAHRLLFLPNLSLATGPPEAGAINVYSEDLRLIFEIPAPPNEVNIRPTGISWYAPTDQLFVLRDNHDAGAVATPPTGVTLEGFSVEDIVHSNFQPQFSYTVPGCAAALSTFFATANPYRSADGRFMYVPCQLTGTSGADVNAIGQRDGVVRLGMGARDAGGMACPAGCPDGTSTATPSPGIAQDFLFDPGSDRGFMPNNEASGPSPGISLLVYDGRSASFVGRSRVGGPDDAAGMALAQDEATGRVYALGRDGLTVIDGRRTPVAPGVVFQRYAAPTGYVTFPVLPADAVHPYTRVLMGYWEPAPKDCNQCYVHDFALFADTLTVSTNPPASVIDSNTHQGPIVPGSTISTVYGGTARGYGFHTDLVGGSGALLDNLVGLTTLTVPTGNLPYSRGSRDLLGAEVHRLNLRDGAGDGAASALGDGNGSTTSAFANCTDAGFFNACSPLLPALATPARTTQAWPFPDAQCSRPGAAAQLRNQRTGVYVTSSYGTDGSPIQTPIPGSSLLANASVDCATTSPANGVTASASLSGGSLTASSGGPTIGVADSTAVASVTPPHAADGVVSTVAAAARGVHIDLGGGSSIDIGTVAQKATATAAGIAGSAWGVHSVILGDVSMTQGSTTTVLCSGPCTGALQSVAQRLNDAFPTLLRITLPAADDRYLNHCAVDGDASKCTGSPGGYIAAVQANLTQQYADQQFNGMSAEESAYLPALRIVVFGPNDGAPNISRQIVDLAGVDVDSEQGLDVLPPAVPDVLSGVPLVNEVVAAGVLPPSAPPPPAKPTPRPSAPQPARVTPAVIPSSLVERTLSGIGWTLRSPGAALEMAAFLGLLLLPFVLMDRRRIALRDILGGRR